MLFSHCDHENLVLRGYQGVLSYVSLEWARRDLQKSHKSYHVFCRALVLSPSPFLRRLDLVGT